LRQLPRERGAYLFGIEDVAPGGRDIGCQLLACRAIIAGDYRRLPHASLPGQCVFDFAQFNAVAADLHLLVHAPKKLERAIRMAAHQVAGAIKPRTRHGGIGNEALGRQFGPVQITLCNAFATDLQLPRHQHRAVNAPGSADGQPGVGNRLP